MAALALATLAAVLPAPARATDRYLDVRLGLGPPPGRDPARVTAARADLTARLGRTGVLEVDPLTRTVDHVQRLDGALSAPSGAAPGQIARTFAAQNAAALGLDAADVAGLRVDAEVRSPTGLTVVRLGQAVDGIPTFDNALRVGIDHAGRVLLAGGAPRHDLPAAVGPPRLTAAAALARLQDQVGSHRPVTVKRTGADARRTTTFSTGDRAQLVLFGARELHLAWHLTYGATDLQHYDAVVDATTGDVLYRANLVKSLDVGVYHNYPGALRGGTRTPAESIDTYLSPGATTLSGPNVHAYADLNDGNPPDTINTDHVDAGEDVAPNDYIYNTVAGPAADGCDAAHQCSWDHDTLTSWRDFNGNSDQWRANVVQTFWYANHYHDHLAGAPGFTPAAGNFQGDDPLSLDALDGAASNGAGGPDSAHVNNANMLTPPDGQSPQMQMYLFSNATGQFRDVNGGDDAAILYHEYTHGLSSRLVTNDDGTEALNAPQAGAMGEGWSDWYAQDFLVAEGYVLDTATDGEVDMGRYVDATPHAIRTQAMDCAVGSTNAAACPAPAADSTCTNPGAGAGGYTYGDFGKVCGRPEVHGDGEIWGQTLWEIRQRLVASYGSDSEGSTIAEQLITDAMRLSIPEPSFLDMRNAILAADVNLTAGRNANLLWEVFAHRGMGFFAGALDGSDVAPAQDFAGPPDGHAPRGTIAGTVVDARTRAPLGGATASIGGLATLAAGFTTASLGDGSFTLDVPQGAYPKVEVSRAGYDPQMRPVAVGAGTTPLAAELTRDWIALGGGGAVSSVNDHAGDPYGCGARAAIDQSQGTGWSADNTIHQTPARFPTAVFQLPVPVTVEAFATDPSSTCGDDISAMAKTYTIETSPDGVTWSPAYAGSSTAADAGRLARRDIDGGPRPGVRYVRLTLRAPLAETAGTAGHDYIDFSELEVYGLGPNQAPAGALTASASPVAPGSTVTFDASSFRDPDGAISSYDWDFDGDGNVDATTSAPAASFVYAAAGRFNATVTAHDFVGGAGSAAAAVTVAGSTAPFVAPSVKRKAKPVLVLPKRGSKGKIKLKVTCKDACRLSAQLRVSATTKRRRHLRSVIVGRLATRTVKGTRSLTVALTKDARRRLARRHVRRVKIALRVTATVPGAGGTKTSRSRSITLAL
jgi:hypothetical protein